MGNCCATRDANDKLNNIDQRNIDNFYFNYPKMISNLKTKLAQAKNQKKLDNIEINFWKWKLNQLYKEVDNNVRYQEREEKIQKRRRLTVEVMEGDQFLRTTGCMEMCKNMVMVSFSGVQKKTCKNGNCRNPKYYECFIFPLQQSPASHGEINIQIINIEGGGDWKLLAKKTLQLSDYQD